ncbi:DUF2924 domain-containing protein [uncultured Sphingomonas sp.]|uniref:DUF2924 domain-containing protein n=1 Tax=uncultured Sphingomonas sp. TaxID=158754 RepID=UPI0035CBE8DC
MQQIEVDFEAWKLLTVRRDGEHHSYNDVVRELLGLCPVDAASASSTSSQVTTGGRTLGGRFLPNGSRLKARYKGQMHYAEIRDNQLIDVEGKRFGSASAAAGAITGTNVNGLTFWEVRRPSDGEWRKLVSLARAQ